MLSDGDTPPPPGFQPLPGAPTVDLSGNNLAQWADHVQEVAFHMRLPPQAVVECPTSDIVGVLDRLEGMNRVRYCRLCFGVSQQCRCSAVPYQAPGPTAALWMLPAASYAAMASPTETTASTSAVGVTPSSYQTSGLPPLEPMDTMPPLTTENLLLTAGVGRGTRGWTPPWIPTAPGPHQNGPRMPHPQVPTPGRQGATSSTPYRQQVFPPQTAAPGRAPPPVPLRARAVRDQLAKKRVPEEGLRLEVPEMDDEEIDHPLGDRGSTDVALRMTIS